MEPVIKLENFSKTYYAGEVEVPAVRDVSLEIQPGVFVAIMGASGSGKSTLMNTIGCLDRPSAGRYLLARTSAMENVELPMLYSRPGIRGRLQRERAENALELVGLGERVDHHPSQLSGGQQQRVAIARALVNQPKILLADEPTGNLDTHTSIEIMGIFQDLNRRGMTVVMVTHELDIARYCLRTVVMRDGRVVRDEPVRERLDEAREMEKLKQEQQAVQLTT